MQLSYQYTFEDYREAVRVHALARRRPTAGGMLGCLVSGGLTLLGLLVLIAIERLGGRATGTAAGALLPLAPWLAVLLLCVFIVRGLRPATRLRSTTLTASDLRLPRMLARGPVLPLIGMLVLVLGMALLPAIQSPTPSAPAGQSSAGAAPAISSPLLDLLFPLVPWMLVFGFIWFFVFRLFRGNLRRMFDSQPTLHRAHTADITAEGVVIVDHVSRFEYRWDAFPAYCESPNLFMIYVSPHQFHMIPKRAFASPQELDACRYMLHTLIGDREPAFPVLPIAAAGRTTDSAVRPGQA